MKKSMRPLWLLCSVVPALACALVRRWQMASAFEGELNLAIPGAPASVVLLCVLVISAVLLLLLAVRQREVRPPRGSSEVRRAAGIPAKGDAVMLTLTVAGAFLALAAAPVLFMRGMELREQRQQLLAMGLERGGNNGLLMMAAAVTALLAFAGLFMAARARSRGGQDSGESMQMLCAVNGCLWLMEVYRGGASDPVLWNYAPLLLAIICGMLFYMDCAGLACGACHPRRTLWLAGMTVVLSAAAMAGKWELSNGLLLASQILAALAVLWRLPVNLEHPPVAEEPQVTEEEIQEEDTHV